jgi:hypothetical protein
VRVTHEVSAGTTHVVQWLASFSPSGREAVRSIGRFVHHEAQ